MKRKATIPKGWRQNWPAGYLQGKDVIEATTADNGDLTALTIWRHGLPLKPDDYHGHGDEISAALDKYGKPDETDAASYVEEAMRGRLTDLGILIGTAEGKGEGWAEPDQLEALGVADVHATDTAEEEAAERLNEYPLSVERTIVFEVVLGTGGPDDRLIFECGVAAESRPSEPVAIREVYEIDRVLYRYSWEGSAERVLQGEDRETAEEFARRVVPELVE